MAFMSAIQKTLDNEYNVSVTENGAVGYRTSGKALLDLNFAVASLRSASEREIIQKFLEAFYEDKVLAMKWLFFARDARQGLGERRLFRTVISYLAESQPETLLPLVSLCSEYGRFDDMWCLLDSPNTSDTVCGLVKEQLESDIANHKAGKPYSLLAKWMPSINASAADTKRYAKQLQKALGYSEKQYRKTLSMLRHDLPVVECQMSEKRWNEINYEAVPSRANLIYNKAFLRNDEVRRRDYLSKLEKGEAKINASVLYPHDIVYKYTQGSRYYGLRRGRGDLDLTIEALWKALPDTVSGCGNTMVVADGSGSMMCKVGDSGVTALDVANALAIYFAEHSSGEFKDKYITFSENPQFVDFSERGTLLGKLQVALRHCEVANTNIKKVFDLILNTAIREHMSQDDIPKNILIISDMEFDYCTTTYSCAGEICRPDANLINAIKKKYADAGYALPRLVFWNVNSRTGTIPIKENDLGVALVSGFSANIAKMVMSGKLDPYECLLETLNSERYAPIESALK